MARKRNTSDPSARAAGDTAKKLKVEKEERKKTIDAVRVGHRDINNDLITRVHMKDERFVIYEVDAAILTDTLRTFFNTLDAVPEEHEVVKNLDKIAASIGDAEDVMSKAVDKNLFKGRMAYAMGKALLGDVPEAKQMFHTLIDQTKMEYAEQLTDRSYYRITALIAALLIVTFALYVSWANPFVPLVNKLFYIAAGGSIGGFFSMSLSVGNMVFERGLNKEQVIFYALERLIFSIFAACVVAVAVRLNLVFGFLNTLNTKKPNNYQYGYVIAAVIAGFSETFLPNLLAKLEKKS
jgi:hypothetical protein